MNRQEAEEINKKLAGLCVIPWHETVQDWQGVWTCSCGLQTTSPFDSVEHDGLNPDFIAHPTLVLVEMKRIGKLQDFIYYVTSRWDSALQLADYILDTAEGRMALAAIEWLEKEEGKGGVNT